VIYADTYQEKPAKKAPEAAPAPSQPQRAAAAQRSAGRAEVRPAAQAQPRPAAPSSRPSPSSPPRRSGVCRSASRRSAAETGPEQTPVPQQQARPAGQTAPAANGQQVPVMSRVPKKKVVDTRQATNINLARYDERLEQIWRPSKAEHACRRAPGQGKQKIRTNDHTTRGRGGMSFSNKRRQDEQERMRRLQLEIRQEDPAEGHPFPMRSAWVNWPPA
jgi:translation initiation factor IF-2